MAAKPSDIEARGRSLLAGRIRVHESLGKGGQGAVFRGEMVGPQGFSRPVAIKRVTSAAPGTDRTDALLDEARLASAVQHPNVVQTLEVVDDDGEYVIVMELVDGFSLAKLMRTPTPIPPLVAAGILEGALRGLDAAHEARSARGEPLRIVHRDFSPQNILVDRFGTAKVLDFGIAKAVERAQPLTRAGAFKGKVPYAAPEQVHGEGDRRVDIWAAGVVLWEALVGRRLFKRDTPADTIAAILRHPIEAPVRLDASLPVALSEVAMRALQRPPEDRYATARAMADDLVAAGAVSPREIAAWVEPWFAPKAYEGGARTTQVATPLGPAQDETEASAGGARDPFETPSVVEVVGDADVDGLAPTSSQRGSRRQDPVRATVSIDPALGEAAPPTVRMEGATTALVAAAPTVAAPSPEPTRSDFAFVEASAVPVEAARRRRWGPIGIAVAALLVAAFVTYAVLAERLAPPLPERPMPASAADPSASERATPDRRRPTATDDRSASDPSASERSTSDRRSSTANDDRSASDPSPVAPRPSTLDDGPAAPSEAPLKVIAPDPTDEPRPRKPRRRVRSARKKRKKPPNPPEVDCTQPYILRDGVKIWRRECFTQP